MSSNQDTKFEFGCIQINFRFLAKEKKASLEAINDVWKLSIKSEKPIIRCI